jgi:hypothetical protein
MVLPSEDLTKEEDVDSGKQGKCDGAGGEGVQGMGDKGQVELCTSRDACVEIVGAGDLLHVMEQTA